MSEFDIGQLRGRRLLIVLDNCEHLLGACKALERLAWFWKTVAPAYEALDQAALATAREESQRMPPDAALRYAATDDD